MLRSFLAGLILCIAVLSGCGGNRTRPLIVSQVSIPIAEEAVSHSPQMRTLPWADVVLESRIDYRLLPDKSDDELPGLHAAAARLEARQKAREDLAHQLSRLIASEAPPGETTDLTLLDFSRRRSGFDAIIRDELTKAEERVVPTREGEASLELRLPLRHLADEVLSQGGGFSSERRIAQELNPRRRAMQQAEQDARSELLRKTLDYRLPDGTTIFEWVRRDPANQQFLVDSLKRARVVRSEQHRNASGQDDWLVELQYDASELRQQARR